MSTEDPTPPETETELRAEDISDELARKYDPERLLKIVSKRAGKGESLDHSVRSRYEKRLGVDLGHVRVYTGEFAEEFNRQRNAFAVTIGSTGMILMGGSADKSMGSASGQALLAHELTHVKQASQGLHRKATFDGGMPFTEEHEDEAEQIEAEILGGGGGGGGKGGAGGGGASEEDKEKMIEKVRDRVLEMMADAERQYGARSGLSRRP
ncbi:MAG: eCIS core domain-containing protein [Kofleriaceae bacterium]